MSRRALSERQFQDQIVDLAHLTGWLAYHSWSSRHSEPGFPDLCAVHPARGVLFAELKTETGRVRPEQTQWIDTITAAAEHGVRARLWRPSAWPEVVAVLNGKDTAGALSLPTPPEGT